MKLTTMTQVTVDGAVQGNGHASDEERHAGFERGGWAMGRFDDETLTFITETYQRADAFLFGRRTYEMFADTWGTIEDMRAYPIGVALNEGTRLFPDAGPDLALDLVDSRTDAKGVTTQVYRPNGCPRYAPNFAD